MIKCSKKITELVDENTNYSVNYEYDALGNVIKQIDPQGSVTLFEYDAFSRLKRAVDALGAVTKMSYDGRGNLLSVTDPNGGTTRYEYDLNDNLVKLTRPSGTVTQYEYDANDNVVKVVDSLGREKRYEYDALGRLIKVIFPDKTVSFSYDAVGNLISYSDGTSSGTYTYDALGRQLTETVNYGTFSLSYSYEYYANGLKKSFTGPDGVKIGYVYDENNRLSAVEIPEVGRVTVNSYSWNSPAKITLPGGSQINLIYDPLMRLKSKTVKSPNQSVIMSSGYEYSPVDNILRKITEHGEYSYEYDILSRLIRAKSPVLPEENYIYDLLGV